MRKYAIVCLQGTSIWNYTFQKPLTRKEIIEKFWDYCITEDSYFNRKKDLTLNSIKEVWNVRFEVIK